MASTIRCPNCGETFSEEEYKNHSCSGSTLGGEEDLQKGGFGEAVDDTGER